jgi:hypothetical protein
MVTFCLKLVIYRISLRNASVMTEKIHYDIQKTQKTKNFMGRRNGF